MTTLSALSLTGFRYCPRCGQPTLEAASDKSIRCTECSFCYFHNAAAAAAAIIETPRGIAFVRRAREPAKGLLDLPGGFVDYREGADQAVVREVREELGVTLSSLEYVGSFPNVYEYRRVTYHTTDMFYRCRYETPDDFVLSDEASEVVFVPAGTVDENEVAFESSKMVLGQLGALSPKHT